jgi:recombinational DNA repair protein RecR
MVFGSADLREAVLRERIDRAEQLINALEMALFDATGMVVCAACYRLKRTEHCPHCTGLEGIAEAKERQA